MVAQLFGHPVLISPRTFPAASFAAASIFATGITIPPTVGEAAMLWIQCSAGTTLTLKMTLSTSASTVASQILNDFTNPTTVISPNLIATYVVVVHGQDIVSFANSTGGTVNMFACYMLE